MSEWIDFDIPKLRVLREEFLESLAFTLEGLPRGVNWNSPQQVKDFFKNRFDLTLENVKIATLERHRHGLEHTCELQDTLTGLMHYYKLRSTIHNYLDNILKHEESGRYHLREVDGIWMMQNKRPLFHHEEIWGCVKRMSPDIARVIGSSEHASW